MLLPHNTYRVPQHRTRHVCGSSCSCKHWLFVNISEFWALDLFLIIWVQYATDNLSGNKKCSFHRPLLTSKTEVNSCATADKASTCQTVQENTQSLCVDIYIYQGLWRGLGGGGGIFWLQETLTFKGPAALQTTAVYRLGVNKIPPNFNTLLAMSIEGLRLSQEFTAWHI
jgi:hypothetical protein